MQLIIFGAIRLLNNETISSFKKKKAEGILEEFKTRVCTLTVDNLKALFKKQCSSG